MLNIPILYASKSNMLIKNESTKKGKKNQYRYLSWHAMEGILRLYNKLTAHKHYLLDEYTYGLMSYKINPLRKGIYV